MLVYINNTSKIAWIDDGAYNKLNRVKSPMMTAGAKFSSFFKVCKAVGVMHAKSRGC